MRNDLCRTSLDTLDTKLIVAEVKKAQEKARGFSYKYFDAIKAILEKRQEMITDKSLPPICGDEVNRLVEKGFIKQTSYWALQRIPVYLETIDRRKQSIQQNQDRDRQRQDQLDCYRKLHRELKAKKATSDKAELEALKWMIEEFAVSLFAQDLGTAYQISAKRLDRKLEELRKGRTKKEEEPKAASEGDPRKQIDKPTDKDLQDLKSLFSR